MDDILFQGHQGFLIPWLLLTTLSLVLQILNIITLFISMDLGLALTLILLLLVQFYSFLCVFSLRSLILYIFQNLKIFDIFRKQIQQRRGCV